MNRENGDALSALRLYCAFTVRYQLAGGRHILMPGQVVPVYDVETWRRDGPPVDIVLACLSVDDLGEPVPAPGAPAVPLGRYRAALLNQRQGVAESGELQILQQARLFALGGASSNLVLRPHRLPLGFGLFREQVSGLEPLDQFEEHDTTLAEAYPLMNGLRRRHEELLPLPRLYVEGDEVQGRDMTADGEPVGLRECMLPVCPRPLNELQPWHETHFLDFWDRAMAHLARLNARRVWLGFDLPQTGEADLERISVAPVGVDEVRAAQADSPILYTLPHGGHGDFYAPLRAEMQARVHALMSGRDKMVEEFLPMARDTVRLIPQEPVGIVFADPEPPLV